jgi:F-type H+-transporting ATPase subunit b
MEIIKDFGIDPLLFGAQVINFLIVLFILKRFLYKPIISLLQKRQNQIKEGITKAIDAQKTLEKAILQEKTILVNANANAKKIIDDATDHSVEISKQIQDNAKKQADRILKQAYLQIEKEAKETEKRLAESISEMSVRFLQKALEGLFTKQQQEEVMKTAIKKLKA